MTEAPAAEALDVCASDPNFAVIFAFCERFGDSCGVTIPTFQELQEMLEKTTEVPDALVDLHIKLLRRVKKSVNADKWERAVIKFCQEYSIPEFWELEHYGYKGISVKLKLRILKTLFEAQFDSNVKFKSEINKLDSSTLHSQPLGWDRSGVAYWVQFDRAYNLRVYKEDIDEDTWEIVAKDRSTLVNLINELSGAKDNTLDDIEDSNSVETGSEGENESPLNLNPEKHSPITENNKKECSTTESTNVELVKNELDSQEIPINFKRKLDEDDDSFNKSNCPIVGEEIEESVMIVKGEGSGQECDTGNPDETNTQNDTSKNEDVKKPKLWSIEAICSSSKEVKEEIVSVPTTGFFFGDDSVPCFNNVSNGENSCIDDSKLKVVQSNENIEESKKSKIIVEEPNKSTKTDEELCVNKETNEEINKNEKLDEVDTTTTHSIKSLNLDEFSCKNVSKQSVFNIKVHEEEVQITERKANEVFTKSETSIKHVTTNVYDSTSFDSYSKPQESQINSTTDIFTHNKDNQPQTSSKINKYDADHKTECNKIDADQTNDQPTDLTNSDISTGAKVDKQKSLNVKLEENTMCNIDQQLEENKKEEIDQQSTPKIVDEPIMTYEHNKLDNEIKLNESNQLTTSKSSQSDEEKTLDNRCEKIKLNESFANTVGQYDDDTNEQPSTDVVEENVCMLDTSSSNLTDQNITSDNQILENKSIIDDEKPVDSLVEENEPDKQVSKDNQITDDLEISATYSNNDLKQHTENDNPIINDIASSSKAHDQTLTDNVDQCPQISKQVDGNQNTNKSKKTSHTISNIMDTDMNVVSDSIKTNEQSINSIDTDIKHLEHFPNEKKPSVVNVDCPKVFNSKHSLNNILNKLDDVKEISECPNSDSSNVDLEINKIDLVKPELEIKEESNLKSKDSFNDLTVLKKDKIIENEKNISHIISSVPENQKEVIDVFNKKTKSDKNYEQLTISTEQCKKDEIKQSNLNVNYVETIQNKALQEEDKVLKIESDTYVHNEENLNLKKLESAPCNKDNLVCDSSVQDSTLKMESQMEIDEEGADNILHDDKNVINKSIDNYESLENEEKETNFDKDIINQNLKIEKNSKDDEDDTLKSSDEQIVTSPVHEDTYENVDETNQESLDKSPKEEFDDSAVVDLEEDNNKSDEEEVAEETPKKKGRPGRKKGKRGRAKKVTTVKQENKSNTEEKVKRPYKPRQKKVVTISEEVTVFPEPAGDDNVRRSRRIAEIKIKEQFIPATQYDDIDIPLKSPKKKDKGGKKGSTPSKKLENAEESDDEDEEDPISKKFKKRRRKGKADSLKKINMVNPWNVDSESSSSENNVELFEDYDHEEEEEIPRPGIEPNVSDHEFSPESDINDEDEEYLPEKRARTAHKKDEGEPLKDDMCQKCNKSDQPEWILLCDTCNLGWHASCLRPPLMVIPDGDWYCPPCRHQSLLNALKETLKKYDGESKKRENEELRRKRLAYVGISLQNVISSKTEEVKPEKSPVVHQSSEEDEEESESENYDSEPLYTLRARRQANVSYRFNDYDDMINEAILEETGVDESALKKSAEMKTDKNDNDEKNDSDNDDREDSPIAPALLHLRGRKKSKKLTNLDISSDDGSDEDFKGPSDEDDDYEEDLSEYSDDSVKRRPQPTRRSVRNRRNVVDPDFINDDSSEDSDHRSKKKRSRPWSDSSNSEEEDLTWGKKKKKRTSANSSSFSSKPAAKGTKRKRSENDGVRKLKKSTIKYGMNSDSDSDGQPKRRTRGRQITYAESDDSEEEVQTKKRKVASDEEDEYVLNDEELEVENEDHTLEEEVDDAVASNEEKDDDDDDDDEDDEVGEEEEDEDEEEDPKPAAISSSVPAAVPGHQTVAKLPPPSAVAAVAQSVIREPVSSSSSSGDPAIPAHHTPHPRLLPPPVAAAAAVVVQRPDKQESPSSVADPGHGSLADKRKRPQHQPKKCPSPNPLQQVDYGGGAGYPYAPDATKVTAVTAVPPSPAYVRPPPAGGVFKTMVAQPPRTAADMGFAASVPVPPPYRTAANKMAGPAAYLPPQVQPPQQIYQAPTSTAPPPSSQPPSAGYSPYPIDYAGTGASLPPPPPLIPFRNVVVAPPLHEHALLPPGTAHPQQQSVTGEVSEFGGLVSYFSSQQEDDFDT